MCSTVCSKAYLNSQKSVPQYILRCIITIKSTFQNLCLVCILGTRARGAPLERVDFLQVCNKCQKRPTIGAKETYYMRTFERFPWCAYASHAGARLASHSYTHTHTHTHTHTDTHTHYTHTHTRLQRYCRRSRRRRKKKKKQKRKKLPDFSGIVVVGDEHPCLSAYVAKPKLNPPTHPPDIPV